LSQAFNEQRANPSPAGAPLFNNKTFYDDPSPLSTSPVSSPSAGRRNLFSSSSLANSTICAGILVFGFPATESSRILSHFRQFGSIVSYHAESNWIRINFGSRSSLQNALQLNGQLFDGNYIIGVLENNQEPKITPASSMIYKEPIQKEQSQQIRQQHLLRQEQSNIYPPIYKNDDFTSSSTTTTPIKSPKQPSFTQSKPYQQQLIHDHGGAVQNPGIWSQISTTLFGW
jgi:hypothetical protein